MKKPHILLAAVLWAAAMLVAALYAAPSFFAQILVPLLAASVSLSRTGSCRFRRAAP